MKRGKNPELAAVISFILPGLGQLYCFHIFWGIFWLLVTAGLWAGVTPLGFIGHVLAGWQAFRMAKKRNR